MRRSESQSNPEIGKLVLILEDASRIHVSSDFWGDSGSCWSGWRTRFEFGFGVVFSRLSGAIFRVFSSGETSAFATVVASAIVFSGLASALAFASVCACALAVVRLSDRGGSNACANDAGDGCGQQNLAGIFFHTMDFLSVCGG